MTFPARVAIREVGPRDGLQAEAPIGVGERIELVEALIAAGVVELECGAFVSPKAVPSMAGTAEVFAAVGARDGVRRVALVPNVRGAELAVEAGADALSLTLSESPAYNEKNVRMTVDE